MTPVHEHPVRVYYEDTDLTGLVYHAGYLRFMERGRTEFLRDLGIENGALWMADDPCAFAVSHMDIRFKKPARMDDLLAVRTALKSFSGVRLVLAQQICRGDELLVEAKVEVAIITPDGRPRRAPKGVADYLQ